MPCAVEGGGLRLLSILLVKTGSAASEPIAAFRTAAHIDDMEAIFILHHVRFDDKYGDDAKLIGVYRTESAAKAATSRVVHQPGFVDHPDGWQISRYVLDQDD